MAADVSRALTRAGPADDHVQLSAFTILTQLDTMLDLKRAPFDAERADWIADDYGTCHAIADTARKAGADSIRYWSARDSGLRANVAVLSPAAFGARRPRIRTTWHLRFDAGGLRAIAAFPSREQHRFTRTRFGL